MRRLWETLTSLVGVAFLIVPSFASGIVVERSGTAASRASAVSGPAVDVAPLAIDFGVVNIGSSRSGTVLLSNVGDSDLNISSVVSSNPTFVADPISSPIVAGGSASLSVSFAPLNGLTENGTITIHSDAINGAFSFIVLGQGNARPILSPIGDKSVSALINLSFTLIASDNDDTIDEPLTFLMSGGLPPTVSFDGATGGFSWTPAIADVGIYPATFSVSDGFASTAETIAITVTPTSEGHVPILNPIESMSVEAGTLTDTFVEAVDQDGDELIYAKGSGPAFMTVADADSNAAVVRLVPATLDVAGSPYSASIVVSDGLFSDTKAFEISVRPPPFPLPAPVLDSISDIEAEVGATFERLITATSSDFNPLTFSISGGPPSLTMAQGTSYSPICRLNRSWGLIFCTFGRGDVGTWVVTAFASTGALVSSQTFRIAVRDPFRDAVIDGISRQAMSEGATLTVPVHVSGRDGELLELAADATIADTVAAALGFVRVNEPRSSIGDLRTSITLRPGFTEAGLRAIRLLVMAPQGITHSQFELLIHRAPAVTAPGSISGNEGEQITFGVSASDAMGGRVALSMVAGAPLGATFVDNGDNTGTFAWTPGFDQAGLDSVYILGSNGIGGLRTVITALQINNVNRPPVANAGGPYTGLVGVPIAFVGSSSSDADGDALEYQWDFGDLSYATEPTPLHAYAALGTYVVTLRIEDSGTPPLASSDGSTAMVAAVLSARAFTTGAFAKVNLSASRRTWCAEIEPIDANYSNGDVNAASFVLKYGQEQVPADPTKVIISGDRDGNGVQEIETCFTVEQLQSLFSGLPRGHTSVIGTLEADLNAGGRISGDVSFAVKSPGSALTASVFPNPLNPRATLTFYVPRPGPVLVRLYDIRGRLVKTLMNQAVSTPSFQDIVIDDLDQNGGRLSSGVYFYRVMAAGQATTGRFLIMR